MSETEQDINPAAAASGSDDSGPNGELRAMLAQLTEDVSEVVATVGTLAKLFGLTIDAKEVTDDGGNA